MLARVLVDVLTWENRAGLDHRRPAWSVATTTAVALAFATVLLALLFVAVVLVVALEGLSTEGSCAANVVSAVGEALSGEATPDEPSHKPSGRCAGHPGNAAR